MINLSTTHFKQKKINITDVLTDLIKSITIKSEIFSHIDTTKLLVCMSSNRSKGRGGIYGKLVPLKFKDGNDVLKYRNRFYTMPKIINNGIPLLYIIYFYMPKFFDLPSEKKLNVIFHELYHISTKFNGDIRRMGEVKKAHGASKKKFEAFFEKEVKLFYHNIAETTYMDFLKCDSATLRMRYRNIYATRMKVPKPMIIQSNQKT